jgi:hypothetical protein
MLASGVCGQTLYTLTSPNEEPSGWFGLCVSGVGDADGDGFHDVVVGACNEDPGTSPVGAGRVYIFSGETGQLIHTLASPSEELGGYFGCVVSDAGDVDGDGYADIVVGAVFEDPGASPTDAGRAYLFSGHTGDLLQALVSPNESPGGFFGWSVSGAGDIDGDGYGDVLVGALFEDPSASLTDAGRAYAYSGRTGAILHTLVSPNAQPDGGFGCCVSGVGDVSGDGCPDIAVGALFEDPGATPESAGRAYIFSGKTGTLVRALSSPNPEISGCFGWWVSGVGDGDGDGHVDVAVGAPFEDPGSSPSNAGCVYLFSGHTGSILHTITSPNAERDGNFGCSVSGGGDIDGDGCGEVVVGALLEGPGSSPPHAGRAYVFSGRTAAVLYELRSPNECDAGYFGCSVSAWRDASNGGCGGIVTGAYHEDSGGASPHSGRAYLLFNEEVAIELASFRRPPALSVEILRGAQLGFALAFASRGHATLSLHDLSGRRVARLWEGEVRAGGERVVWPVACRTLRPGFYVVTLTHNRARATRRVVVAQ